jgi:hypothetical protein
MLRRRMTRTFCSLSLRAEMLIMCIKTLQIRDMKTQAIIVAAPVAFTLGLLSSIFAVILGIFWALNLQNFDFNWSFHAKCFHDLQQSESIYGHLLHLSLHLWPSLSTYSTVWWVISVSSFHNREDAKTIMVKGTGYAGWIKDNHG